MTLEYRTSLDGTIWSPWTPVSGAEGYYPASGAYVQYRLLFEVTGHLSYAMVDRVTTKAKDMSRDITPYVESVQIKPAAGSRAGTANLRIANPGGIFDVTNPTSEYSGLLDKNQVLRIRKGYGGSGLLKPVFYGLVTDARAHYERGFAEVIDVTLLDRSKLFSRRKVTSELYEKVQANDIVTDLMTSEGGLAPGDIELSPLDCEVWEYQAVDETLMDAIRTVLGPKRYTVCFDGRGKLISRPPAPAGTPKWNYGPEHAKVLAPQWGDADLANKVVVYGRTKELYDQILDLEKLDDVSGSVGLWDGWDTVTVYYSADHLLKAVEPELRKDGNPLVPGGPEGYGRVGPVTYAKIVQVADTYVKVSIHNAESTWNDGSYQFEVWAKPVGAAVPGVIIAEAHDDDLIAEYGEIVEEIEDLPIFDYTTAEELAQTVLQIRKWQTQRIGYQVLGNPELEPGDVITIYNPRTDCTYWLWLENVEHSEKRGSHDLTQGTAALIQLEEGRTMV